jgi:uncharacterized protein (DUF433 family)
MSDELRAEYKFDYRQSKPNRFSARLNKPDGAAQGFPTEHQHIERRPGVCGGIPHIAVLCKDGVRVEEMLETYPHLQASWIHDAISYYLDHREEIEREIEANRIDEVLAWTGGVIDDNGIIRFPGKTADE